MSSVDDVSQVNYLSTTSQVPVTYSVRNYSTLGLSLAGTFTTRGFTVEGSDDGHTWTELPIAKGNSQVADTTILAAGSYIVGVAGYAVARLAPDTVTGQVTVTANISTRTTPAFTVGF